MGDVWKSVGDCVGGCSVVVGCFVGDCGCVSMCSLIGGLGGVCGCVGNCDGFGVAGNCGGFGAFGGLGCCSEVDCGIL